MKIKSVTMAWLCFLVSIMSYASGGTDLLQKFLMAEAQKDLQGKSSCFKGALKAKYDEMSEAYGGRFQGSFEMESLTVTKSEFRAPAKYCDSYLDKNGKPTTDESQAKYRVCESENLYTHVAVASFGASTSGTVEAEGLVFKIDQEVKTKLVVDNNADWFPTKEETKSEKKSSKVTCSLVKF